jgi:hypothetical protein
MYLFSVSSTKPNGMDDVNVNKLSDGVPILMYKKFFGGKIYDWKHHINETFNVVFRVKDITLCNGGGYRIWCEILSLKCNSGNKINSSVMNLLQSYFKRTTNSDLRLCSIDDVDIVILNRDTFEIVEKKSLHTLKGGYDFYNKSIKNYSYTSPKDELTSLTGYKLKFY